MLLHSFNAAIEGSTPPAGLVLIGTKLYGVTRDSSDGNGSLFSLGTDGSSFATIHRFYGGEQPTSALTSSADGLTLYGITPIGGSPYGQGTVFKCGLDGSNFTTLYQGFGGGGTGTFPEGKLLRVGSVLYGTTVFGGTSGRGTLFKINTDGTGFATLHNFTGVGGEGIYPNSGVIISGTTLYGTTQKDESIVGGTIFKIQIDGTGFATLHGFRLGNHSLGQLLNLSGVLYGTTRYDGNYGHGMVFKMNLDGSGFTTLYSFAGGTDGGEPVAGLVLLSSKIWGTTFSFGVGGAGVIFSLNTDGTSFSASSADLSGGLWPTALLVSGSSLYGTTWSGGAYNNGAVFKK